MADVRITYESLFDLLRRERTREELQQLDSTFFQDVVHYLKSQAEIMEAKDSTKEIETAKIQIKNIKKILKELYERREKKIINTAIDKNRSPTNIIDTSALLPEEKKFFETASALIAEYKNSILGSIINMKPPELKKEQKQGSAVQDSVMIRFLHPLPKFLGKNREIYGPFDEDEMAKLPKEIADLLIRKERAEAIKA